MPIASDTRMSATAMPAWAAKRRRKWIVESGAEPRVSYMSPCPPSPREREAHEGNDGYVERKGAQADPRYAHGELIQLERNVDGAAHGGEPFGPGALAPKAIGFGKAHRRIDHDQRRDHPELGVAHVFQHPVEHVRIALAGIEVQASDQLYGQVPEIARDGVEHARRSEQRERALERLEDRDPFQPPLEGGRGVAQETVQR